MFDKLLDLVFVTRPMILIPSWLVLLLGYYRSGSPIPRLYPSLRLVESFFAFSLVMAATHILNQIYDRESDRINDKVLFLPRGVISVPAARVEAAVLVVVSMALALTIGRPYFAGILTALLLGIFYSVPPIKLKARPVLDLAANSLGYGLVGFSLGWMTGSDFSTQTLVGAVPYVLAIGAVFVNTTIPDIDGDRRTGNITTAVLVGKKVAVIVAVGLLGLCIASGFFLGDYAVVVAGIASLPFFIAAALKPTDRFVLLSTHCGVIALALVTSFFFPYFFVFLAAVIFATRYYYKRRFNVAYPGISL